MFAGFKIIILFSVFSPKIWLVKTTNRIVKYESRVVKLKPEMHGMTSYRSGYHRAFFHVR